MPELPEVETIRLGLAGKIIGSTIRNINVLNPKSFSGDKKLLVHKKVINLFRRAKILGVEFTHLTLLVHLKMSGQLIYQGKEKFVGGHPTRDMFGDLPNKSTRVIFEFDNGGKLYFNDQRKFGWIKLVENARIREQKVFDKFGPEPLEKEFTWEILKRQLVKRKNTPVKVVLLDQAVISGIGNIYACEACFLAGINPNKKTIRLTDKEYKKLHLGIINSLKNGIKYGGSSKTHFVNPEGKKGLFLNYAFVYSREKLPCKICKTPINKIKLGGRGTYFCPACQK